MSETIKERIKKLLRLGRSANQNEAAVALQKAWELAQQHHLSVEELDAEKDLDDVIDRAFPVGQRISLEHKMAATVISEYFHCHCILAHPNIRIIGEERDALIGEYVLHFLVSTVRHGVRELKATETKARRGWNHSKRAGYVRGFFYAIHSKLIDASVTPFLEAPDERALMRVSRVQNFVSQHYTSLVKVPLPQARKNRDAVAAGYSQGQRTDIRTPIATQAHPHLTE